MTAPSPPRPAALGAEQRLALACALDLEPAVVAAAASALTEDGWATALRLFRHHFLSAFALRKLRESLPGGPWDRQVAALSAEVERIRMRGLLMFGTLRTLHREHFGPLNVPYVNVKGLTLAARYYGDYGLRVTRDIDVLVAAEDMERTLRSLFRSGYRLQAEYRLADRPMPEVDQAVTMARFASQVPVVSPQGVLVEVHSGLDRGAIHFPPKPLLERAETVRIHGDDYPVLATADLFPFICHHHTKHQWSRLHWLLDLTMMIRHPSFDAAAVRARAEDCGLARTVEECRALPGHLSAVVEGRTSLAAGKSLPAAAAQCVHFADPATPAPEFSEQGQPIFRTMGWGGLMVRGRRLGHSLRTSRRPDRTIRLLATFLQPAWSDYRALPLPRRFFWAYWVLRPLRLASIGLRRG